MLQYPALSPESLRARRSRNPLRAEKALPSLFINLSYCCYVTASRRAPHIGAKFDFSVQAAALQAVTEWTMASAWVPQPPEDDFLDSALLASQQRRSDR